MCFFRLSVPRPLPFLSLRLPLETAESVVTPTVAEARLSHVALADGRRVPAAVRSIRLVRLLRLPRA
jgi:hypothetical protein